VPDGFENVLTLSLVLALFQIGNALVHESGIVCVVAAGMVVGNVRTRALKDLMEFKEQLTLMFIGLLFVVLAADVRLAQVVALGWPGVVTVAALMFVVRPLDVWISAAGSDLSGREKLFLSWLAPRGVVAAAVASLFAEVLGRAEIPGGEELRALVFSVIAATVVVAGLTSGLVARGLGLRRPTHRGYVILGANDIGRALGRMLTDAGVEVAFIDNSPGAVRETQEAGFQVVWGNAIEERTHLRAEMDERQGAIAVTPNEEINLLFASTAKSDYRLGEIYVALRHTQRSVHPEIVETTGSQVLFGRPRDLDLWSVRMRRDLAVIEAWMLADERPEAAAPFEFPEQLVLPLVLARGGRTWPFGHERVPKGGDVLRAALFAERVDEARTWMEDNGWRRVDAGAPAAEPRGSRTG